MKRTALIYSIIVILNALLCLPCSAQDINKVVDNGEDEARFYVLLADGYTAAEAEKFKDDSLKIINYIFSNAPLKEYNDLLIFTRCSPLQNNPEQIIRRKISMLIQHLMPPLTAMG